MRNSFKECFNKLHKPESCPVCVGGELLRPYCPECDIPLQYNHLADGSYNRIFCPKCGYRKGEVLKEEDVMNQKEWWIRAYQKFIENLLSVKVWILGGGIIISSLMVWHIAGLEEVKAETLVSLFSDWCAYNGGTVTAVIGLREAFKVAKIKNGNGEEKKKDNVLV
jgi:NAD-dependent SIR2 family protein deacetylase